MTKKKSTSSTNRNPNEAPSKMVKDVAHQKEIVSSYDDVAKEGQKHLASQVEAGLGVTQEEVIDGAQEMGEGLLYAYLASQVEAGSGVTQEEVIDSMQKMDEEFEKTKEKYDDKFGHPKEHDMPEKLISILSAEEQEFEDIKFIKKNDTCCIVGFAASWAIAPYDKQASMGIDFWGINELYCYLQETKNETPFAAWFEIHDIKNSPSKQKPYHQAFLRGCKIPLITQRHWDEYPKSIAYPRKYVKQYFNNSFNRDFDGVGFSDYSNQISWMIALAICLGYKKIMVYGVDMASDSEYAFQRASCQFFLGYAAGRGITLNVPAGCQLLKAVCDYGFESDNKNRFTAKDNVNHTREQQLKLRKRNGELDYLRARLEKEMDEVEVASRLEIRQLEKLKYGCMANKISAEDMQKFLDTMPEDVEKIKIKKKAMYRKIEVKIKKAEEEMKSYEDRIKEVKRKRDIKRRDVHVNNLFFDDEQTRNEKEGYVMEGTVIAYNHMLNNNLL
jgi:hypothetical protein